MRSLRVGWATDPAATMGPVINPPSGPLARALTELSPGETWLVEPQQRGDARLWSPGVIWGVQPGAWFHVTECFGPVLGIVRARDLDEAIEIQNAPEYGLTGGLHSLDPKEIDTWLQRVQVGNAYVNRHITGAIVQRQPFGGWKRSSIGGGAKPGGPSHLHSYGAWEPRDLDVDRARQSFDDAWASRFGVDTDPSGLRSESNILRHHPLDGVVVRAERSGSAYDVAMLAAQTTRTPVIWSDPSTESDEELAARLAVMNVERLRLLSPASDGLLAAAHSAGVAVDRQPVSDVGDVELPHWLKEQAISVTRHRHGRLLR